MFVDESGYFVYDFVFAVDAVVGALAHDDELLIYILFIYYT